MVLPPAATPAKARERGVERALPEADAHPADRRACARAMTNTALCISDSLQKRHRGRENGCTAACARLWPAAPSQPRG
jgi:hypothetical protein